MSKYNKKDDLNPFEKQLKEINQWQNNSSNPGYFVGSGKAPLPMRNLIKSPILILIIGVAFGVVTYLNLKNDFTFQNILNNIFTIILSAGFLIGGIYRFIHKN